MKEIMRKIKYYKTPILTIFSFLFGCMLTINLTPVDRTCRIEDSDREYNIMKNSKLRNPELIIIILSAPQNLNKRNTIRQTWLNLGNEDYLTKNDKIKVKMKHYFVVGSLNLKVDEILHLSSEQSEFSDILILPMHDCYANLSYKVLNSFEWLNEQFNYGLGFKYVLKCDDDSFVRLDLLADELDFVENNYLNHNAVVNLYERKSEFMNFNWQSNENKSNKTDVQLFWGYFNGKAQVRSSGKWKESNWIACDRYIPYALGGGYVLSKGLVTYIAKSAPYLRVLNSEDVSVGFWLSPIANILRVHDIRFDTEWTTRGCQNHYLITHNVSLQNMHVFYNNILSSSKLCKEEKIRRPHYFYNFSAPPSQCCTSKIK